jgi:hypothetical protein
MHVTTSGCSPPGRRRDCLDGSERTNTTDCRKLKAYSAKLSTFVILAVCLMITRTRRSQISEERQRRKSRPRAKRTYCEARPVFRIPASPISPRLAFQGPSGQSRKEALTVAKSFHGWPSNRDGFCQLPRSVAALVRLDPNFFIR